MNHQNKVVWAGLKLASYEFNAGCDLPWRKRRTPYRIFLAEMMLVRTRADVVSRIYENVFEQYPDIYKLAEANEDELRELLRPLGLLKRVPYIIRAARYVCENHGGEIPYNIQDLLKIPGVGLYTAVAEATFAYGHPLVPSDVNILRFIARLTGVEMEHKTKGSKALRKLVPLLTETQTGLLAEKLLDFTRLVCRSRNPLCERCPLIDQCVYFQVGREL
jgi:A/G-specific adenine glycosylase